MKCHLTCSSDRKLTLPSNVAEASYMYSAKEKAGKAKK